MAQIKLTEVWKATHTTNNPLNIHPRVKPESVRETRSVKNGALETSGSSTISTNCFIEDAKRVWNSAPVEIKSAKTIYTAKKEIKKYCISLPI